MVAVVFDLSAAGRFVHPGEASQSLHGWTPGSANRNPVAGLWPCPLVAESQFKGLVEYGTESIPRNRHHQPNPAAAIA
jgi:hypothetical protein